jgi:dolichyl-phosphate-mannose-protein mannosyltransferase
LASVSLEQQAIAPVGERVIAAPSRLKILATSLLLFAAASLLFGALLNHPPSYVFDEMIYVDGARSILSGHGILSPEHPPLAKLMFAASMAIFGDNAVGWRLASVTCGSIIVVAIFLWTWLLTRDYELALVAACLTLFNNFLFVMSRTTMLDIPMLMFAICALLAYTAALKLDIGVKRRRALVVLTGVLLGLSGACKWTAVNTLGVVLAFTGFLLLLRWFPALRARSSLQTEFESINRIGIPTLLLGLVVAPGITYSLAYIPVFVTSHTPFSLAGVLRIQVYMWTLSKGVSGNRAIFSPWYKWPFMASPMRGLSYLMGNPAVMWTGVVAIAICCWRFLKSPALAEGLVALMYFLNLLQWIVTPRPVTFYYYYFPSAMMLSTALAVVIWRSGRRKIFGIRIGLILIVAAAAVFLYCYPRMTHLDAPWDCMFGCWI